MKVDSPIGELPFEPKRLGIGRDGIVLEGAMGAWPAHVTIGLADVVPMLRLFATKTVGKCAAGLGLVILVTVFGKRRARQTKAG